MTRLDRQLCVVVCKKNAYHRERQIKHEEHAMSMQMQMGKVRAMTKSFGAM